MKKAPSRNNGINSLADCAPKTLLPLLAVGGSFAAGPAAAIELGDATVQSQLGQPLRASIAFALAPKEQLSESCISQGPGQSGLPGIGRASISIADGALLLRGSTPLREPMVATNVVISCPSAAHLAREYILFIDPAGTAAESSVVAQSTVAQPTVAQPTVVQPTVVQPTVVQPTVTVRPAAISAKEPVSAAPTRRPTVTVSPRTVSKVNRAPIGAATRYHVQRGDSLSEITQRIENRPPGLWAAVNTVFEANPDAFIDNDPNKLKAGSWLTIPSFDGSAPVIGKAVQTTVKAVVADVVPATNVAEVAAKTTPAAASESVKPEAAQPPEPAVDATTDLQPAAQSLGNDNAGTLVEVATNEAIDIPDTALVGPETPSTSPNVTTAVVQPRAEQATSSWVLWLAGSGVAIILALLLFGRSLRNRFGSAPESLESELPVREVSPDSDALELRDDVDYNLDDSKTVEFETLDADLLMGTGLNQTIEVDPAEDVGFPSPTEVDIELPFAAELETAQDDDKIRSASLSVDATILESEILPDSDDYPGPEDFDMSVILDATKMPQPEDVAESALEAMEMDSQTDTLATIEEGDDSTQGSSIDLTILEQDYEDELSATQALDMDVTQAALLLSAEMENAKNTAASTDDDATAAMSLAEVSDFDVKTHLEADNDEMITLDEELTFDDELTIQFSDDEETVEMAALDDDKTREMPAKPMKLKKKAG